MSLFLFLTVVQAIVAAALVAVILMQRSEGGGLGIGGGGSPGGLMSARGAADFLTRATRWLAILFVVLSIALAAVAVETTSVDQIDSTLDRKVVPANNDPLGNAANGAAAPEGANGAAQGEAVQDGQAAQGAEQGAAAQSQPQSQQGGQPASDDPLSGVAQ